MAEANVQNALSKLLDELPRGPWKVKTNGDGCWLNNSIVDGNGRVIVYDGTSPGIHEGNIKLSELIAIAKLRNLLPDVIKMLDFYDAMMYSLIILNEENREQTVWEPKHGELIQVSTDKTNWRIAYADVVTTVFDEEKDSFVIACRAFSQKNNDGSLQDPHDYPYWKRIVE